MRLKISMEKSLDIDNAHKHDNSGKCASGVSLKYRLCLNQLSSVASRKSLFQLSGGSWWWLEGEGVTKLIHYVLHGTDQIRVCVLRHQLAWLTSRCGLWFTSEKIRSGSAICFSAAVILEAGIAC